jgi:hypothetical protein
MIHRIFRITIIEEISVRTMRGDEPLPNLSKENPIFNASSGGVLNP